MPYSAPYTFTALELMTAAKMNAIQANISAIWTGTTAGDIEYYTSSTAKTRVANPGNGYFLESATNTVQWVKDYRSMCILLNTDIPLLAGDDQYRFRIPAWMNNWRLYSVAAARKGGSSGAALNIQVRNVSLAANMLSTALTVDSGETDSTTAATAAVIDAANDDVLTSHQIAIDVDVPGTNSLLVQVELVFIKP